MNYTFNSEIVAILHNNFCNLTCIHRCTSSFWQVPVEVPQVMSVELLTEVPKPQYEQVPKEIPKCLRGNDMELEIGCCAFCQILFST